ncbi:MAG: ribonuclease R [Clostridia bacterium]|nr:ribonuclease R [Clostridia bacterium]
MRKKRGVKHSGKSIRSHGRTPKKIKGRIASAHENSIKRTAGASVESIVGSFSRTDKGYGFVTGSGLSGGDLFIAPKNVHGALTGDTVRAVVTVPAGDGRRAEGEVVDIISRALTRAAGIYKSRKTHGAVYPLDASVPEIYIPKKLSGGARSGEIVGVAVTGRDGEALSGEVERRMGRSGHPRAVYDAVLYAHDVPTEFPRGVLSQADAIEREIPPEELWGRLDLRAARVFTIDGEYAKDFDDAVSIDKTPAGTFLLGVHIADVAHYVREGSPIDREAYTRGTSVYFVDRVVPMLPERLSNDVCSLVPNGDRLTLSCIMELDPTGEVLNYKIRESVINSRARLIYSDVSRVLGGAPAPKEYPDEIVSDIMLMNELQLILRARRTRRGGLDLDLPEPYIELDGEGVPVDVRPRERGTADNLIEEFMLCANETVARHLRERAIPAVYRTHGAPSPQKADAFLALVSLFSLPQPKNRRLTNEYLTEVIAASQGQPFAPVVLTAMLRSLMKAEYDSEPKGHFGLALSDYCHFTSPIRRYPDLCVHRALKAEIHGRRPSGEKREREMKDAARQSTATELRAVSCEREIEDLYKAIFMSKFVGETFTGVICAVSGSGFFAELPNTVRGMVTMDELNDDYYIYDDKKLCLFGKHMGKKYQIGDIIKVKLLRTDINLGRIDFSLA